MTTNVFCRTTPLVLLLMSGGCDGGSRPPSPQTPAANTTPASPTGQIDRRASDSVLSREVTAFLEEWLIRQDPRGAVRQRASAAFTDERFVPGARSAAKTPSPIQPQEFQNRLGEYLQGLTDPADPGPRAAARSGKLSALLLPLSLRNVADADPELAAKVTRLGARDVAIADVPCLAYPVRTGSDIAWTSSETVGYPVAMEDQIRRLSLDVQAVVCRLQPDGGTDSSTLILVVTLWSDEGRPGDTWRLVGVELPLVK